ncbi:hypothetical protein R6Q59_009942 [Mikania micrantha]
MERCPPGDHYSPHPHSLIGSGQVDKAAIFDVLGTSCWAASPGFTLKPDEVRAIASSFTNLTQVMATGFHLQGEKYMAVRAEATCIVGKKVHYY